MLSISLKPVVRDTAAGTRGSRWKDWGARGALTLKTAYREMDSFFVLCREENYYQKWLVTPLTELRRRPAVWTVLTLDVLCLREDLRHV